MGIGLVIFIVATIGWHIGMYGMFKKAAIAPWKALVPFYNTWCMVDKMKLKKYWFFFQLIPIAGQFITIWITIKFVEHFGRFNVLHHALTTFFPFIYFPYLGFSANERYAGDVVVKNYKKSAVREWIDAAAFAVVAATLIRTFVFEAYTIPTPSMEKSLLVNDFLFVSKFAYGPRIPNTPIAMPFVHHTMPFVKAKAYSEAIHIPYTRWFASPIKRNDAVVFNFPANDTLIDDEENFGSKTTYYEAVRFYGRPAVWQKFEDIIITRPVDKRENFIKRCVAIAGDTLSIVNGVVHINGVPQVLYPESERLYALKNSANINIDEENVAPFASSMQQMGIQVRPEQGDVTRREGPDVMVNITNSEWKQLSPANAAKFTPYYESISNRLFPYYDTAVKWSADNFGPLWVPKKGVTIPLSGDNVKRYERCIIAYEGNTLSVENGKVLLNGKEATTYTFKLDYFWLMGDNRHNSLDSRYWGFVPEDHVVGKASLIWFSWQNGPRWKRLFQSIK